MLNWHVNFEKFGLDTDIDISLAIKTKACVLHAAV